MVAYAFATGTSPPVSSGQLGFLGVGLVPPYRGRLHLKASASSKPALKFAQIIRIADQAKNWTLTRWNTAYVASWTTQIRRWQQPQRTEVTGVGFEAAAGVPKPHRLRSDMSHGPSRRVHRNQ